MRQHKAKQAKQSGKLKKKALAMRICCALALGFAAQPGGPAYAAEAGASVTVEADSVKETTADASGQINYGTSYTDVTIQNSGRWRPMDAITFGDPYYLPVYEIYIDKLDVKAGGIIDLTWQETPNPVFWGEQFGIGGSNFFRNLWVTDATLADGAVFRISAAPAVYNGEYSLSVTPSVNRITLGSYTSPVAGGGTIYVQLGNIIGFDPLKINSSSKTFGTSGTRFLTIYEQTSGQFRIAGQASYLDAPLNVYKVTPVIETSEAGGNEYQPEYMVFADLLDYTVDNTGLLSESAKTAGDMQLAMRNLWRLENANTLSRLDELHTPEARRREGIWTNAYGGRFTNNSSYGRSVRENYHGLQVGYDQERPGGFYGGRLYTGLFFQQTRADTGLHTGSGSSESSGFGAYAAWVGRNGRYLDLMLRGSKLHNDYYFYSNGGKIDADYHAWAFGLNARYGLHKPLTNGWFWEPHVGLAAGRIDDADYPTSNGLQVTQGKVDVLTGQVGVLAGRSLGEKGNFYARVTVNHDFAGSGSLRGSYSGGTQAIETGAARDTWCELALGANARISPSGNFNVNVLHTFGGDVKTDWQVNGGFNWRWGGFASRQKPPAQPQEAAAPAVTPAAVAGSTPASGPEPPAEGAGSNSLIAAGEAIGAGDDLALPVAGPDKQPVAVARDGAAAGQPGPTDLSPEPAATDEPSPAPAPAPAGESAPASGYALEPVVVEAPRPAWEDKLSPGTVTVIEPDKYKGEQKTLPDLLKEVPGVHVRYSAGGIGQYTTVSVRGSTASQVGVFVDGVLTNLGGDAAVDISTIPVKNVARIEVYRGYVPARFGGTYMGGVINIVTKKPEKADISASYGQRSWGGYTGSLQVDAPLGSGSLMVGINRDQSDGDFRYTNFGYQNGIATLLASYEQSVADLEGQIARGEISADNTDYIREKNYLAYLKRLSPTRYRMNNSYKNTDALLKWQDEHWQVKAGWKQIDRLMPLSLSGNTCWDKEDVPDEYSPDAPGPSYQKTNLRKRQELTAKDILVGRRDTSGNLEWGWNVNYLDQEKRYSNPDLAPGSYAMTKPLSVWSAYDSRRFGASLDGSFKAGNHLLDFLLNYSRETMDIKGWRMDDINSIANKQWKYKYRQTLFNVQLQDTITLNDAGDLWFTPSIRYNSSDILGSSREKRGGGWLKADDEQRDSKTTWQFALKKKVSNSLTLRASYGKYYRLLNLYEIAGDGAGILPRPGTDAHGNAWGSVYPQPEEGIQWDVGAAWKGRWLKADADISLTYFSRRSENLLQLQRYGINNWCYVNAAKGKASGVELQSNLTWAKWDLNLAATYVHARSSSTTGNTPAGLYTWNDYPMTYTPEWEGKLRLTYRPDSKTALFTEINYTGEQYYADSLSTLGGGSSQYMQTALTTVGLGCRYQLNKNAQLVVGVNDLFDKGPELKEIYTETDGYGLNVRKESNAAYPLQGRTYYATVQYNF
ncbi:MAG TPA: TonB-dependent receptor [Methylomusa anaerophila]|uniref:Pertactin autotransporter n=1 Tax=Methylomusa anaerophila TaxID=1930071 RepID=A0A348AKB5_9FIRM|nr:TonB-dependent receptor [Methylomusa anaerophila]BBB91513.1 pertactin autotransporter precursor [Methylomusa anaerophila]HML89900.1 TonB-dependent receptor [Methylomusa anaerophila]